MRAGPHCLQPSLGIVEQRSVWTLPRDPSVVQLQAEQRPSRVLILLEGKGGNLWFWSGVGSGEEEETVLEGKYFRSRWGRECEMYHLFH